MKAPSRAGAMLLVVPVVLLAWVYVLGRPDPREELDPIRVRLLGLRLGVDSCRVSGAESEARLLERSERADSLRGRIRSLEALDGRGVPADSYPTYIDSFNEYRDAVARWDSVETSARQGSDACRALTRAHNALGDSLRTKLEEFGLLPAPQGSK